MWSLAYYGLVGSRIQFTRYAPNVSEESRLLRFSPHETTSSESLFWSHLLFCLSIQRISNYSQHLLISMDIDAETDTLDLHFHRIAPEVRGELESMLRIYHLTPQELFYKWESYSIRMGCELNYNNARNLKKDIQDQLDREAREKVHMRHPPSAKTPRTVKMLDVNADL